MFSRKYVRFQELIESHKVIRLRPKFPPEETIHGIPLAASEKFVVLQEIHEFHLDGYSVIPLSTVRALRAAPPEEMIERVLTGEGVFQKAGLPHELRLDSFASVFRSLKALGKNVIIELLPEDSYDMMEQGFFIGRIVGMSARSVAIRHFDAVGQWTSEPSVVPYDMIKWVTFDTEYINVFSKYLSPL